ncbi:MAG: peptidoglycan DD-metalloendopeptidase family protein [Deltaproteobacteria bacterium]|nr:peptidoglycan DD-metalloendopeptidase family protein [Deltaproteobacteria bacterium]
MRTRLNSVIIMILFIMALLLSGPSYGIQAELEDEKQGLKEVKEAERRLLDELDELTRRVEGIETSLAQIQDEIVQLKKLLPLGKKELQALERSQARQKDFLYRRLRVIYRLREGGVMQILFNASSIPDFLHRYRYLASIIAHDESALREYDRRRQRIKAKMNQIKLQEIRLKQLLADLRADKKRLIQVQNQKTAFLMKVHQRKQTYLALIRAREASRERLIKEVIIRPKEDVSSLPSASIPASRPAEKLGSRQWPDFAALKGKLPRPVGGRIKDHFGRNPGLFGTYTTRHGVTILASSGRPVKAVARGEVIFASWLKGYGNVVIINHGRRYYTLTAGITRVKAEVGQWVNQGDYLGLVPYGGKKNKKGIYLEIRHRGKALNPGVWLGSTLAAQEKVREK